MDDRLTPEEIRRHKGISFPGVSTAFMCHDGHGNLLFGKRSKNARDEHGRWDTGGGGLKHGQTLEENLRRELMEEYGVEPEALDFVGYHEAFRKNPDGIDTHWINFAFIVKVDRSKVRLREPDILDELKWFPLDDLPSPLHSQFMPFYRKHEKAIKKHMGIVD